jgi:integrase
MRLTDIAVRHLAAPSSGQRLYRDESLPGFGVRISQGGTKTFVLVHGRDRQFTTIGRYPIITLAQARQKAGQILAEKTLGHDQPKTIKFSEAYDLFKKHHCARKKPRTAHDYEYILDRHFLPKLRHDQLHRITAERLAGITDKVHDRPSEQAHAIAVARTFFRWCVRRRYLKTSPMDGMQPPRSAPRDRVLSDPELSAVWKASGALGWPFGPFVRLCILLGQRRGEIAAIRWAWIDQKAKTISFPREIMKGNRPHVIPYGDMTAAIVETLPRLNSTDLLFPARGNHEAPLSGFSKFKAALDNLLDIPPFTIHDLRRSMASGWQRCGIRVDVTERYLAHRSGTFAGIVSVYQQHDLMPEMRAAVVLWEQHLLRFST